MRVVGEGERLQGGGGDRKSLAHFLQFVYSQCIAFVQSIIMVLEEEKQQISGEKLAARF